jgi:hypothetical protein
VLRNAGECGILVGKPESTLVFGTELCDPQKLGKSMGNMGEL